MGLLLVRTYHGKTIIGSSNVIGHHALVGVKCQDLKYKVGILVMPFHAWMMLSRKLDDVLNFKKLLRLVLEAFR